MFVAVVITAYITVFALFLTAIAIGLATDRRRNRRAQEALEDLRQRLDSLPQGEAIR